MLGKKDIKNTPYLGVWFVAHNLPKVKQKETAIN
jgi:hypothetical protein